MIHEFSFRVALAVRTYIADRTPVDDVGYVPASIAGPQLVAQGAKLASQITGNLRLGRQQPQNVPVRRLLSHPGKT